MQFIPVILFLLFQGVAPQANASAGYRLNHSELCLKAHQRWIIEALQEAPDTNTSDLNFESRVQSLPVVNVASECATKLVDGFERDNRSRDGPQAS